MPRSLRHVAAMVARHRHLAVAIPLALLLVGTATADLPASSAGTTDVARGPVQPRAAAVVPAGHTALRHDARAVRRQRQDRTGRDSSTEKPRPARSTTRRTNDIDRLPLTGSSA